MVSPDRRLSLANPRPIGRPLIRFDRVTSTMDVATAFAELGAPEGTVVQADLQTAGRGRAGRFWEAPPGSSLMLSIILRPQTSAADHGRLSLLAGLAVARTTGALTSRRTTVKWPNDVLLDGRKVSGILLHSRPMKRASERYLILGIGINVRSAPASYAISLCDVSSDLVEVPDVLNRLIPHLNDVYQAFRSGDVSRQFADLNDRLAYRDQEVVVADGERTISGKLVGIGQQGELILRHPDGSTRTVVSGELTRGPRPTTC